MDRPQHGNDRSPARGAALKISLIYLAVAAAWIFLSDQALEMLVSKEKLTRFQTAKGLFYVLATSAMLYLLVRNTMEKLKKWQQALAESEDRFRRLVEWSPSGIFITYEGNLVYANRAFIELLGATDAGQLLGRPILDFVHPDYHASIKARRKILLQDRQPVPLVEERYRRLDGTYIWLEVAARPFDHEGKPAIQAIVRDITGKKQAEQELRQLNETLEMRVAHRTAQLQQANEDLKTFAYTISHDLRTHLRTMRRFADELIQAGSGPSEPLTQDRARRIVASAARLEHLIQDLLEYNQLARTEIRLQRVSLVLVVHEVVGQLQRDPEFDSVDIRVHEPMSWVLAHRPTLALVVQNLIHNAVQSIPGEIKPVVKISAEDHGQAARLIVEDNGLGIDPVSLAALFELQEPVEDDSQARRGGLAMVIVRRAVERMGGRVGAESATGEGGKVWIELPKDPQSP